MLRRGVRNTVTTIGGVAIFAVYYLGDMFPAFAGWGLLAGIVLVVGTIAMWVYDSFASSRLRREHVEFAELHGWRFFNRTREYSDRFAGFPFAGPPESFQENVIQGSFGGARCATFTHVRVFTDDKGTERHEPFQVTLAELPVYLPRLELVPEKLADKFAKALGGGDMDVESYEFNKRWRVLTRDYRYAHSVLDPRMVERLIEPDALKYAILIEGGAVLMWRPEREGIGSLAARLGVLTAVARRIPQHVVREYRDLGAVNERAETHRGPSQLTPLSDVRAPRAVAFDIFNDESYDLR